MVAAHQIITRGSGLQVVTREGTRRERPVRRFKSGTVLKDHLRETQVGGQTVHEFIGTDNFAAAFYERQRYEVDSGRDLEPVLYTPIYTTIEDSTLPRNVPVNRIGPAGVVFERIEEGGEVKFASVGQSNFSIPIIQYGFGIEYTKALVMFNELWSLSIVERQAGVAFNALMNHIHLYPIISATYGAANQTAAVTSPAASLPEAYLRTFESAMVNAVADATNPRRGPYVILCSTANVFTLERALTAVPQQGVTLQTSAINRIRGIIAYDGWTGTRGAKATTYPGVTANTCYLIDLSLRERNFQSYIKQGLQSASGNADVSRFILEQTVWDTWFGTYTDAVGGVEEVTLPTTFSAS